MIQKHHINNHVWASSHLFGSERVVPIGTQLLTAVVASSGVVALAALDLIAIPPGFIRK